MGEILAGYCEKMNRFLVKRKDNMRMKEKLGVEKIIEWLFLGLLIIQTGFVVYFNLSDIRCSLDFDVANTFYHYMEVIKNGTLRLEEWNHTTSLELDGSFFFAIPLYYITRDIFLAVGISNIIIMVLYLLVISRIFYHARVSKLFMYIALCLVVTPYSYGMLEYFNMMFYGGACYSIKTLVPLLFLLLIQLLSKKESLTKKEQTELGLIAFMYVGLLLITTFSTGFYAMLCGVIPMLICLVIDVWLDGGWNKKYNWKHVCLVAGSFLIFLLGNFMHNDFYPDVSRSNMRVTKLENYAINFRACVAGLLQVFGATTSADVEVMSFWGIFYCLKMGIVVLFIIVFFYNFVRFFYKTERLDIRKYLAFIFLFNFLVLLVADCRYGTNTRTEYRYFLIGVIPLVLLLSIQISEWREVWNMFQYRTICACMFAALAILIAGNNGNVIKNWDRTTYAVELCEYFKTLDIDSVFFVDDPDTSIICKGLDSDHKYGAFITETQTLHQSFCSYKQSTQGAFYGNRNVVAVIEGRNIYDQFPEQIARNYTYIGKVRWYDLYISDRVYFP